jgi:hypothetical protein
MDEWPTEELARWHAAASRNAFVPLMAMISWLLSHLRTPGDTVHTNPSWTKILLEGGAHQEWVENFRLSPVPDFLLERIGMVIDAENWKWKHSIDIMVSCNVSVWIFWGKDLTSPVNPLIPAACFPSSEQVPLQYVSLISPCAKTTPTL